MYPSIVQPHSQKHPYSIWKPRHIALVVLLVTLSPILFPLWLVVFLGGLTVTRLFTVIRSLARRKSGDDKSTTSKLIQSTNIKSGETNARKEMVNHLNEMTWEKHGVAIHFQNAHSAIVVRSKRVNGNPDVVQHFIDAVKTRQECGINHVETSVLL